MSVDDRTCVECGSANWTKLLEEDYPQKRRERDRTIKHVYKCAECGAEGRHFERQDSGTNQFAGALRG